MNLRKFAMIFVAVFITGCGQQTGDQAAVTDTSNEELPAEEHNTETSPAIDGYKDLKFGMSSSSIARTESCNESYIRYSGINSLPDRIKKATEKFIDQPYQDQIDSLTKRVAELQKSNENSRPGTLGERFTLEDNIKRHQQLQAELEDYLAKAAEARENPDPIYAAEVQPLIDELMLAREYDPSITDAWINEHRGDCSIEFMGSRKRVSLQMKNGLLSEVDVHIGDFDNEIHQSIAQALSMKYPVSYTPTDTQIAAFNAGRIKRVSHTFANDQVVLTVFSNWGAKGIQLSYLDLSSSKEKLKTLTQGAILPSDI